MEQLPSFFLWIPKCSKVGNCWKTWGKWCIIFTLFLFLIVYILLWSCLSLPLVLQPVPSLSGNPPGGVRGFPKGRPNKIPTRVNVLRGVEEGMILPRGRFFSWHCQDLHLQYPNPLGWFIDMVTESHDLPPWVGIICPRVCLFSHENSYSLCSKNISITVYSNTVIEVEDISKWLQLNKIKLSLVFPRVTNPLWQQRAMGKRRLKIKTRRQSGRLNKICTKAVAVGLERGKECTH